MNRTRRANEATEKNETPPTPSESREISGLVVFLLGVGERAIENGKTNEAPDGRLAEHIAHGVARADVESAAAAGLQCHSLRGCSGR